MLNLFRHSEAADLENILARHAIRNTAAADDTDSQEKQFRDLLQALPAAIYTTDAEGRITFFNRPASSSPAARRRSATCGA